jgi:DNA-binding MarR family transcriptional regulator
MTDDRDHTRFISDLIDRLGRLNAAEEWNGPLNPSQFAALSYLARANRFSRAPSHVADYLATTRGTASQTLKALARKELIAESRLEEDKRSIRYDVTD